MAKSRPQSMPAKRPPTPDPKDVICPHQHFKYDIIDRDMLSRKQHLNLLCTPKGYRWVLMKGDAPDGMRDQDDPTVQPCKVVKKKPGKTYVHNILAELWSILTPEMVNRLKEMLMAEFGLTEEAAEDFICHSRYDTIQTAQKVKRKKEAEEYEFEEADDEPPNDPTLPRLIVEPKLCDKSQFAIGIDPCHIKEFSRIVSAKFAEYVAAMMCARRNNRHRRMAEVVLNGLCNLTGEKTTLDNPKNRLQKILTLTSDRVALWLAQNMEDDDSKRARRRKQEDEALKKRKLEKQKEQERRRKQKEKMKKEIERNKKRKAQEDAEIEKQKQEEQERKEAEKERRRQEIEKFREEDKKRKQEEQKKAKEDEEKKKQEKKEKQEQRKQKSAGGKPTSAASAKKEDQSGAGKKPGTAGQEKKSATDRDKSPSKTSKTSGKAEQQRADEDQQQQDRTQPGQEESAEKQPGAGESEARGATSEEEEPSSRKEGGPAAGGDETDAETATGAGGGAPTEKTEPGATDQTDTQGAPAEPAAVAASEDKTQPEPTDAQEPGAPGREPAGQPSAEVQPGTDQTAAQAQLVEPTTSDAEKISQQPDRAGETPAEDGGAATVTDSQPQQAESESQRKLEENIIALTASKIVSTKPVATPRQETLQDILNKELEKVIEPKDEETSRIIREVASKTATWMDQNVKDAEVEYGSRDQAPHVLPPVTQKPKGPSFVIKKTDPSRQTYDVRLATHTEVGRKIRAARRRNIPSSAQSDRSDPRSKMNWAVNASQMADEWGHWIDKTIQDAEDKAVQYQTKAKEGTNNPQDEEDWKRFVESTTEDALTWRRKKKALDEAAKEWKVNTR